MDLKLIEQLKSLGIKKFKNADMEIEFKDEPVSDNNLVPAIEKINNERNNTTNDEIEFWSSI